MENHENLCNTCGWAKVNHAEFAVQCGAPIHEDACKTFVPLERVDHPRHYNSHPSGIEAIVIIEHMTFNVGNAVKYCWRSGQKGALVEDLKKAIWYLQREVERLEKEGKK